MEGGGQWKEWADYCLLDYKGRRAMPPNRTTKTAFRKDTVFSPVVQTFELAEEPNCLACVEAEISAASNDNEVTIGKGIKMGTT